MNALFATYVPAINAYLCDQTDTTCKKWSDVVATFFAINVDRELASKTALAELFDNADRPNYFRIDASLIDHYFDSIKISNKSLVGKGLEPNVDFVEDSEGLRLTFECMTHLIFSEGNESLVNSYKFINKVHKMFGRYEMAMMNRCRRPTHWTLVERIDDFTSSMQPHVTKKEESFKAMNTQPKVYCIMKGTKKTLEARLRKYTSDNKKPYPKGEDGKKIKPKYAARSTIPIQECILSNVDEEISYILNYLNEFHAKPYRVSQCSDSVKIGNTKHSIKTSKTFILIDPSQTEYTPNMLKVHIKYIRSMLQYGKVVHSPIKKVVKKIVNRPALTVGKPGKENTVDIEFFTETKGHYIDTLSTLRLIPREDNGVSIIGENPTVDMLDSMLAGEDEDDKENKEEDNDDDDVVGEDDDEDDDEEEDEDETDLDNDGIDSEASEKEDPKPKKKAASPKKAAAPKKAAVPKKAATTTDTSTTSKSKSKKVSYLTDDEL